ncbi:beta-lactamase family protein [Synechocystis sp. FACHB-383]|uniref:serine hydrolase domain-containing protein n=1 Tax=Synechocystis sp. FACHB-383 TaxID=2692864 RepID=UPI001689AB54|nr:serine hydrolase domain-containing protein [Synechocystis sp. FACHB-383]MBD2652669.1 beta-lactamase family protein [Synechocystis sp. FACHB-383]
MTGNGVAERFPYAEETTTVTETVFKFSDNAQIATEIKDLIEPTLIENGPGVAILVLSEGEIIHAQGYGLSDIASQTPITPNTVFDLASVSKQMTAIAVLKLMEQGALELDDPVSQYLPDFQDANRNNPITLSHLLYHTSGLADYTGDAWDGSDREFANLDLEAHLVWLNDQATIADPGTRFEYNNSGYTLLALVVERVSGQPFADFMATEIFGPIGMDDTLVYRKLGQFIPNQATGYAVTEDGQIESSSFPSVIAGDGNVFSTLNDLAHYDNALRQGTLVSTATLDIAFSSGNYDDGGLIDDDGEGYGMGWQVASSYVHHSGSWLGTSTYYRHYKTPSLSIVVLSNDEAYDGEAIADEIAAKLLR